MNRRSPIAALCLAAAVLTGCAAAQTSEGEPQNTPIQTSQSEEAQTAAAETSENAVSEQTDTEEAASSEEELVKENDQAIQDATDKLKQEQIDQGNPQPDDNKAPAGSNDGNASKPTSNKTADGKYNIAPTDLQNSDGTFTQDVSTTDSFQVPGFLADKDPDIFVGNKQSNPSKIPYSEITVANAAEAFPYLGFIGYTPDYVEVLPTDTEAQIRIKVMANLSGDNVDKFLGGPSYNEAEIASSILVASHCFNSEAEYKEWCKQQEAEAAAAAANQRADERFEAGGSLFHESEEELQDIFNSRRH